MKFALVILLKIMLIMPLTLEADVHYSVLDFNSQSLPENPLIFQKFTEKILCAKPDMICLREIGSDVLAYNFYERLEQDYHYGYLEDDSFIASRYPIEKPQCFLTKISALSTKNNVIVTINAKDETHNSRFSFNFLEYTPSLPEKAIWAASPFFDHHAFIYQNDDFIIVCKGGGSISGGRDTEGNVTGRAEVHHEYKDDRGNSWTSRVEGNVNKDSYGKTSGEIKGSIEYEWE